MNFQERFPSRRAHQKRKDSEDRACRVEEVKKDGEERATGGLRRVMVLLQSCCQQLSNVDDHPAGATGQSVLMRVANQGIAPPPSLIAPRACLHMEGGVVRSFNLLIFSGTFRLLRLVHNRAKQRVNIRAKDREYDNRVDQLNVSLGRHCARRYHGRMKCKCRSTKHR